MKMHELLNENTEPSNPETNSPKGPVKWTRENDIVAELKAAAQSIRAGDPSMTREKYQEILNQVDKEILAEFERIPNGSMFRYGPKAVNQADACVDPTDMSCPGHQAGMKCELEHPNSPEYCHGNNLSFDNGVEQAKNMMARGFTANSPTIWGKGGFIKGATNTAQYRTNNKQAQQQQQR